MASTKFPFEIETAVEVERFAKYYKDFTASQVGPKKYVLGEGYEKHAENIYNMPVQPDDTFVVTFPRSGTTLTQELVWLIKNDLDFEKAKCIPLTDRYPFLDFARVGIITMTGFEGAQCRRKWLANVGMEFTLDSLETKHVMLCSPNIDKLIAEETDKEKKQALIHVATPATEVLAEMPSPRFIKSHLPISLLPAKTLDTAKVVYVARDPRDVLVSYFHFQFNNPSLQYQGDFKAFFDQFISDCLVWSPFLEHVKEGWELRYHPNVLFLFYEDIIKNMADCMRRVAKFFDKQYTDEQFAALAAHLHIDNFKNNSSVDPQVLRDAGVLTGEFVRKGKSNGWSEYLDNELQARMDQWMQKGLRGSTLRFPSY